MSDYSAKLKSPLWQRRRLEILNRDDFTCCKCGDKETELHVHHLKYTGEPHEAPNEDLETLCKHCHSIVEYFTDIVGRKTPIKITCLKQNPLMGVRLNNNMNFIFIIHRDNIVFESVLDMNNEGDNILKFLSNPNG